MFNLKGIGLSRAGAGLEFADNSGARSAAWSRRFSWDAATGAWVLGSAVAFVGGGADYFDGFAVAAGARLRHHPAHALEGFLSHGEVDH